MILALHKASRSRYPEWKYMIDGDGVDENLNFFFSSRRRHTSYIGDWSSDVCSSDLLLNRRLGHGRHNLESRRIRMQPIVGEILLRSEERRVGKEWRSWWKPLQLIIMCSTGNRQ